jgi:hypothetical protein
MIPHLVYYQLVILALLWLCLMLPHLWPSPPGGAPKTPIQPIRRRATHHRLFPMMAGLKQALRNSLSYSHTLKHRLLSVMQSKRNRTKSSTA